MVTALVGCSGQGVTREQANDNYQGPPVGAIRFDGWSDNPAMSWYTTAALGKALPAGTKWHYRQPSLWNNFQLWGAGINTQAILDSEIAAANGILDFFFYDWYTPRSILVRDVSNIQDVVEAHFTSAHKTDVKAAFIIGLGQMMASADGTSNGENFAACCTYIHDKIQDSAYFRMPDGKPLIALYNGTDLGGWVGNPDRWTQLKTAIGEPVFALAVNSTSMVSTLGLQGNFAYEYNGSNIVGAGRHHYPAMVASDIRYDGTVSPGGPNRISSRTVAIDERPINAGIAYTDSPTQPEWYAHMQTGMSPNEKLCIVATWDEITEQGIGLTPSIQEGTRYLDAIKWIKDPKSKPSTYSFKWSANWVSCGTSGTWTEYFPNPNGVQGAHDGDQLHSSETDAYREITLARQESCDIYAETGPDCGIVEILRNGTVYATVDTYAASQSVSVKIATVTFIDGLATNTARVRVTGTKNASSSAVTIKLDYFKPTYSP